MRGNFPSCGLFCGVQGGHRGLIELMYRPYKKHVVSSGWVDDSVESGTLLAEGGECDVVGENERQDRGELIWEVDVRIAYGR